MQKVELEPAFREMRRVIVPGGPLLLAFHAGEERLRPGQLWGIPIDLEWVFHTPEAVIRALQSAGWRVEAQLLRDPYPHEHPSRRAYLIARSPQ
jgi:hypothetical protein